MTYNITHSKKALNLPDRLQWITRERKRKQHLRQPTAIVICCACGTNPKAKLRHAHAVSSVPMHLVAVAIWKLVQSL